MVLHFWSLSFDFKLLAGPIKNQQIGIGYVSRSLNSFAPAPEPLIQKSEKINDLLSVTLRSKKIPVIRKPSKTVAKVMPVKSLDQLELVKSETIDTVKLEELSPETSIIKKELPDQQVDTPVQMPPPLQPFAKLDLFVNDELLQAGSRGSAEDMLTGAEPLGALRSANDSVRKPGFQLAVPQYDRNPPPKYPEVARRRGWQGTVQFEVLVLKSGRVGGLDMVVSTGYRSLDNAARKSINRWTFVPATSFGVPVDSRVIVPVDFVLGVH